MGFFRDKLGQLFKWNINMVRIPMQLVGGEESVSYFTSVAKNLNSRLPSTRRCASRDSTNQTALFALGRFRFQRSIWSNLYFFPSLCR